MKTTKVTVNETWKLLLNRMNIIPSWKSFPACVVPVMWFIGTVLLFHLLDARSFYALRPKYTYFYAYVSICAQSYAQPCKVYFIWLVRVHRRLTHALCAKFQYLSWPSGAHREQLWRLQCEGAFTPDTNKSREVGRLNILSLLASFAREIHYTTDANSRHGRGFSQAAPVWLQNVFLFL